MALPKYFSKDLLAINRLINTSPTVLTDRLSQVVITVAFDTNAFAASEGRFAIEMLVRLISRLYPKIKVVDLSESAKEYVNYLVSLAKSINDEIEIVSDNYAEDFYVLAGSPTRPVQTSAKLMYFGSDNWIAKFSMREPQSFGDSQNPIGAGVSACLVASNIFRLVFKTFLPFYPPDEHVSFSVFNLSFDTTNNPTVGTLIFDDVVIVGVGAIGNGMIWTLSRLNNLEGRVHLVDDQDVTLSNLQRYVLFDDSHLNLKKVTVAKEAFKQPNLSVSVTEGKWDSFVSERNNWSINCVAVGIDNDKDRIAIQSSLPRYIYNAFTESEAIGISRHCYFGKEACLACSYIPLTRKKDFITEVAENCNIPDKIEYVKICYNLRQPVDFTIPGTNDTLLGMIAVANGIPIEELSQFKGMRIDQFYSDFVCGGIILKVSQVSNKPLLVDAPLAFQSAFAGILLAAEVVKHFMGVNLSRAQRSDIYHLSPLEDGFNPFHRILEKDKTGRCLCCDPDFVGCYNVKWNVN